MNLSSLGSAEYGSDYTAVSTLLTFPATTSSDDIMQCIDVSILDDSVFEGPAETFTVTVTTTNPRVTLGNNNTTVTIIDNDGQYDYA